MLPDERRLFLTLESCSNFAQHLVLLWPARLECPGEDLLKMIALIHGGMKKNNVGAVFRPGYLHFHFLGKMHPKDSRFIGSSWVTQPFLLTRAVPATVELKQTVENRRHSVVLKGLLGFPPSGD
jgi:hypothetical protein